MHPTPSAPLLGSVLADRYEVVRLIARGGMSEVFEARDLVLQRSVAVKVYRAGAPVDRRRFDAEVVTLASLSHPGLVQVFDAGERHGDGFVVLELIDGPTLREVLQQRGPLPPPEVAALGGALADALAFVHDAAVVHRDVTPSNVLCEADGRPRLADFGIARLLDTTRVTATSMAVGTAAYMAPEQVEGRDVTPAADVYSLGLVLIEALAGRPAFAGPSHEVAVARLVRDPELGAVPSAWRSLLGSMTARDPAARPSAEEVNRQLAGLATADAGPVRSAPVDGHAVTEAIPVPASGGTMVMPAVLLPEAQVTGTATAAAVDEPPTRSRLRLWLALAAVALAIVLLASQSGGGIDRPARTPTTEPVAVTTAPTQPPTTAAPPTTPSPPSGGKGERKGHGKKAG